MGDLLRPRGIWLGLVVARSYGWLWLWMSKRPIVSVFGFDLELFHPLLIISVAYPRSLVLTWYIYIYWIPLFLLGQPSTVVNGRLVGWLEPEIHHIFQGWKRCHPRNAQPYINHIQISRSIQPYPTMFIHPCPYPKHIQQYPTCLFMKVPQSCSRPLSFFVKFHVKMWWCDLDS